MIDRKFLVRDMFLVDCWDSYREQKMFEIADLEPCLPRHGRKTGVEATAIKTSKPYPNLNMFSH